MEQSTAAPTTRAGGGSSTSGAAGGAPSLQSSKGATSIADSVVTKIAGIAAREVPGVHDMGGGAARALGGVTSRVGLGDERGQGVSVEVGEEEAAVDLTVVIDYGESIPQVSEQIRENVSKRIEGITGLRVTEVNVAVNDLYFPGDDTDQQQQG
jgi:uncharacterized alkaline shock family protein YloU